MNIVILGYTGLIGETIVENLLKNTNFNLTCVGRSNIKKVYKSNRIRYYKWDFVSFKKSELSFLNKANFIINCVGKFKSKKNNLEYINFILIKKLIKYIINYKLKIRFIHLSSVSVYGVSENLISKKVIISENTPTRVSELYSKSKLNLDTYLNSLIKRKSNQNLSFTILRISNVFGKKKYSNLYSFVLLLLKFGFWLQISDKVMFNFINVKDVSQAIKLIIFKTKISRNKTYILSDDCRQLEVINFYRKFYKKQIKIIILSKNLINFLLNIPLPKKLINFLLLVSSEVSYSNKKIIKELNFKPKFSLRENILLDE